MKWLPALLTSILAAPASAGAAAITDASFNLSGTFYGFASLVIFFAAYTLVTLENRIQMRKSKPVLLAAGIIWILLALSWDGSGHSHRAADAFLHGLTAYAELLLFLLPAMTYINALEERDVFQSLRALLVTRRYSLLRVYWTTGALAFLFSPFADNLTTALLLGAVVMAVGGNDRKFISLACTNVVVAANAGGAFSPFGDITTLMVWQNEKVAFQQFFTIAVPSAINWLVPATAMQVGVSGGMPQPASERVGMKRGARTMVTLFVATVATAVWFHAFLDLPASAGMMLGLGYLGAFSYYLKKREGRLSLCGTFLGTRADESLNPLRLLRRRGKDLGCYLENLPYPAFMIDTDHTILHWNSALERLTGYTAKDMVGTAAGVALLGTTRGIYSFGEHLKWAPVIALGYGLSILCHLWLNARLM